MFLIQKKVNVRINSTKRNQDTWKKKQKFDYVNLEPKAKSTTEFFKRVNKLFFGSFM